MKKKQFNMYALYTIVFVIVFSLVFFVFLLRGNGFVSAADGYNQSFPVFVYIREYFENLFAGNITKFDFRIGLGDDVIQTMNYYCLMDVFSIISVFLFPAEYVEFAYYFSVALKIYLSGITFLYFMKSYVRTKESAIVGALLYAFNIYGMFWGIYFTPYLTAMITLPLILKGIDDLCEKRHKISRGMILALFIQGLNGFYHLYIEIMITVVYFVFVAVFRLWQRENLRIKEIFSIILNIIVNGILGVATSAVVLLPSIIGLFNSTRNVGAIDTNLISDFNDILNALGDLLVPNVYNTITTLSIISLGGVIFYFFNNNRKKEFLYLTVILWILTWCPMFGSIMNGFSYSSDRWYFSVTFFANVVAALAIDSEERIGRYQKVVWFIVAIATVLIHICNVEKTIGAGIRIVVFLILSVVFVYVWNIDKNRNQKVLIYTCIVVTTMGLFTFGPKVLGGSGYSANFKEIGVYREICESDNNLEKNESIFQRWDFNNSSYGASLVANFFGTTEYFSTLNSNVSKFFVEMFISPGVRASNFILKGIDGRKEIMALLSTSKYMDYNTEEEEYDIKNNEQYLPLGFTYDSYILKTEFNDLNPMEKSTQILNTVVLEDEELSVKKGEKQAFDNEELECDILLEGNEMKVYIPLERYADVWNQGEGEIYVYLKDLHGTAEIYVGNKNIKIVESNALYYMGIDDFWINLTEIKKDAIGYYFDIEIQGEADLDSSKVEVYWHPIDESIIESRKNNTLRDLVIENNLVRGNISLEENEVLFLSIPYSTGWKAFVDREEVNILKANIGFMAIPLKAGSHDIELVYDTPGLKMGLVFSIFSIITVISIDVIYKRKKVLQNLQKNSLI